MPAYKDEKRVCADLSSHGAKSNHCIIHTCKQYLQFVEQSMQESEEDGKAGC